MTLRLGFLIFIMVAPFGGIAQGKVQTKENKPNVKERVVTSSGIPATLDQMIGQMIMVGMADTTLEANPDLKAALQAGIAGGVILFEKNLAREKTAAKMKKLTSSLQHHSPLPLLIAIDQEGGRVNRLKPVYGFPESRTATWIGGMDNKDSARFYAGQIASTLKSLGINLNFAPVVDLCSNPGNPVIAGKERCYSSDPALVTKHAGWFIDAHRSKKILTTLKHFPGHGSSDKDTHLEMTDVTRLWTPDELIPYRELIIQHKADAIMSAHIVHCSLDTACLPSTLSYSIITGLLRDSLEYQGVVFSDDMQMKAITTYYGLERSVQLAINAGVDILLFSNNIPGSTEHHASVVHKIISGLVATGQIPESRIRESYERIIRMKKTLYPQFEFPK